MAYVVVAIPLLLAASTYDLESSVLWWMRLAAGLLLSVALWCEVWSRDKLLSLSRTTGWTFLISLVVGALLISWTPFSDWLARSWPETLTGGWTVAVLSLITVLGWGHREGILPAVLSRLPRAVARSLGNMISVVAWLGYLWHVIGCRGLIVFFSLGLANPSPFFVHLALWTGLAEVCYTVLSVFVFQVQDKRLDDVQRLGTVPRDRQESMLRTWATELVTDPAGRRNIHLAYDLVNYVQTALMSSKPEDDGRPARSVRQMRRIYRAIRKGGFEVASRYGVLAALVVQVVEEQAVGRDSFDRRTISAMRAWLADTRATLAYWEQKPDEELRQGDTAAAEYAAAGMINHAALRVSQSGVLRSEVLGLAAGTEESLVHVVKDTKLTPVTRELASVLLAKMLLLCGARDRARQYWESRAVPSLAKLDIKQVLDEIPIRSGFLAQGFRRWALLEAVLVGRTVIERVLHGLIEIQELQAGDFGDVTSPWSVVSQLVGGEFVLRGHLAEYNKIAELAAKGHIEEARNKAEEFLEDADSVPGKRWLAYRTAALSVELSLVNGSPEETYKLLLDAIKVAEQGRFRVTDADYRIQTELHEKMCAVAIRLLARHAGEPGIPERPLAQAVWITEMFRSRALLDLLAEAAHFSQRTVNSARAEVDSLELGQAGIRDAEYAQLDGAIPLRYDDLVDLLPEGKPAVLVTYYQVEDTVFIFVGRRGYPEPVLIELSMPARTLEQALSQSDTLSRMSLRALVAPILDHSAAGDLVWLVPHGGLHHLPLHVLLAAGDHEQVVRNPVCITPSASVMRLCQDKSTFRYESVLTISDSRADRPLVHARLETRAVAALFPTSQTGLEGGNATRDHVAEALAGGHDVVHIACHGAFDEQHPLSSGIDLADGRLTTEDLMRMRVRTNLVVLSACESGRGRRRTGDEIVGLTRALLYAGAPSILVSLWNVDDNSTGILMQCFYRELLAGASRAEALRAAQDALRQLTLGEAITYCSAGLDLIDDPVLLTQLDQDVAALRSRAGDFGGAAESLRRAAQGKQDQTNLLRDAARLSARARHTNATPDYERGAYLEPYHWAPFVLIGDWR